MRELHEVGARTILLVAPAGYGKTTLADQWIDHEEGIRLAMTEACLDIRVLAQKLAATVVQLTSIDRAGIDAALTQYDGPFAQASAVADSIVSQLSVSLDQWIVVDDYHLLARSSAAEELIGLLERSGRFKFMIASRVRPIWATARRFVHLELVEFGPADLAFDEDELEQMLHGSSRGPLLEGACGWPVVIALAARHGSANSLTSIGAWSEPLYQYFAEEIYSATTPESQTLLSLMALAPSVPGVEMESAIGLAGALAQAESTGFVRTDGSPRLLQPLARDFVLSQLSKRKDRVTLIEIALDVTISQEMWSEAFGIIRRFGIDVAMERLVRLSFPMMMASGQVTTLAEFLTYAVSRGNVPQPLLDLVTAELALRDGSYDRATGLASAAAHAFEDDDALKARSLIIAGEAARLAHRLDQAAEWHAGAAKLATRPDDVSASAWSRCLAAIYRDSGNAAEFVRDFEISVDQSADSRLRLLTARHIQARLKAGFSDLGIDEQIVSALLEAVSDPRVRAGWFNAHGYALVLQGRYETARQVLARALKETHDAQLRFAQPHLEGSLALAELGMRQFSRCATLLRRIEERAREDRDLHLHINAAVIRARLCLAQRRPLEALAAVAPEFETFPSPAVHGEYAATRGLALAVCGSFEAAADVVDTARALTTTVESEVVCAVVDVLVGREQTARDAAMVRLLETVARLGVWDGFVCGLRASPELTDDLVRQSNYRGVLEEVLKRSKDASIAKRMGLVSQAPARVGTLSGRECEVLDLIRNGLKNREIAEVLFIGTSTVKTHVDNILAKLGASTRAEAVAVYAEMAAVKEDDVA